MTKLGFESLIPILFPSVTLLGISMLTDTQCLHFAEKGYVIYERGLSWEQMELLHHEADILLNHVMDRDLDLVRDLGCIIEPLACGYIDDLPADYRTSVQVFCEQRDLILDNGCSTSEILFSKMSKWSAQLLQCRSVYLLNEQYIIKPPSSRADSSFRWHTDGEYLPANEQHIKSVACWTALDDVDESNGSLTIKPLDGSDEYLVNVAAGSIVFLSNRVVHKSTANQSRLFRRAYMPQYSAESTSVGYQFPALMN
ncbi:hypothetical protein BGW37DRAFT_525256 [Umbelopsis sp. PMI_123]|nr:hypothetical protein BGW37DRAFT_525256 [Umbelopsis sp. PMI_123]